MEAVLATQTGQHAFAMRGIKLFADGSGGTCALHVTSSPFSASIQFTFDHPPLARFVGDLKELELKLVGEARLGLQFEEPFVLFRGDGLGHITVSGVLVDYRDSSQRLEFEFTTDQTALGPFIRSLEVVKDAHAT